MIKVIELTEAAMALRDHLGPRLAASRLGGRQRVAAALCDRFALDTDDAERIVAALERCQAVVWEPDAGLARPCPSVLELCGEWLIRPERLQVSGQAAPRGAANMAGHSEHMRAA
jgi:hypothetical protein